VVAAGFGGSDKVYSVLDLAILGYRPSQVEGWSLLHFAVDPRILRPIPNLEPRWDVTTIGYLGFPLSECELRTALHNGGVSTTLAAIHCELTRAGFNHSSLDLRELEWFLLSFMRSRDPAYEPDEIFRWLMSLYEIRVLRPVERSNFMRRIISTTRNVQIFGNGQWLFEGQLSYYLGGRIRGSGERSSVYSLSKIVMHNGNLLVHDRSLEAMACGACVILNHSRHEDSPSGITPYFSEGEHFAFFNMDTISAVTKEPLIDNARRARIGRLARERVLASFTWQYRVKQIVEDFLSR